MQIQVNGEMLKVQENISLTDLVSQLELGEKRIAIELNLEIIPRSQHAETVLKDSDRVEIVHAIGGG
ncbi:MULTISPECIES: sulfur carrier protein ThiS [unclassified Neptuniibacter]|jgi:sulfur carrier protein|uniref:sulfur carrier protein ThiS n=1 Tax=unclassified Neptuniibacter TaxID=2630693 RepID=UPI000C3A7ACA|nr:MULTISPECIES: sulfur carrier protein ThiS [unclassified Neptuniibacter]MAY41452.1 thiamine biosynthesis protein ThiS [Oceanospirillaceae bacterium]|tara:strand:+ start:15623 stop:15823 length:201 start_codon:yes stop_codon:yes gene_type:complete